MSNVISSDMVRDLRIQHNLTQEGLAEKSTLGIATIKRIEASEGEYRCRFRVQEKLAEALNVDAMQLSAQQKYGSVTDVVFSRQDREALLRQIVQSAIVHGGKFDMHAGFLKSISLIQGSDRAFQNTHFNFAA